MADNSGEPPDQGDLAVMDSLARELRVGIGLAEGEVQRLIGRVFSNPRSAENGLRTLIGRGGLEHALAVMEKNSLARTWHFGGLRSDFRPWRARTVQAALAELPEALRKLQHLNDRQRDLHMARRDALRRGPRFTPDDDPPPSRPHSRKRSRQ